MMKFFIPFAILAFVPKASSDCHICGSADVAMNGEEKLLFVDQSCGYIEQYITERVANSTLLTCEGVLSRFNDLSNLDLQSYCECEGSVPPDICTLCSPGQVPNLAASFVIENQTITCEYANGITPHINNSSECPNPDREEGVCCTNDGSFVPPTDPSTLSPTRTPTMSQTMSPTFAFTEDIGQCYLCGKAESMGNPEKAFLGESLTCKDMDDIITDQATSLGMSCDLILAAVLSSDDVTIDVQAYCGCDGVKVPETCEVCGEGEIPDPEANVPGEEFSCVEGYEYSKFVIDEATCIEISLNAPDCCISAAVSATVFAVFVFTSTLATSIIV